jgi:hypothetical protein
MTAAETAIQTVKFFVNGRWEQPGDRVLHPIANPAIAEDVDRAARAMAFFPSCDRTEK